MLESSFIAPLHDNNGNEVTAATWVAEAALLATFGGYTREDGITGAWRDGKGRVYHDESARYVVASDWTDESRAKLRAIVADFAWRAAQETVYLKLDSGAVEFVAPIALDTGAEMELLKAA